VGELVNPDATIDCAMSRPLTSETFLVLSFIVRRGRTGIVVRGARRKANVLLWSAWAVDGLVALPRGGKILLG